MKRLISFLSLLVFILSVLLLVSCGDVAKTPAATLDSDGYYTRGTVNGEFSWSLDESGVLKITMEEGNKAKQLDASNAEYLLAIEPLRDKVTHIELERFAGKIVYSGERANEAVGSAERNLCALMPNLLSVHFVGDKQNFWVEENNAETSGLFYGASSLKTVWFGDNKQENVIDLSGVGYGTPSNRDNYFSESLFFGCSSVEKVILPRQIKRITELTFEGCSSLKEISLGMGVEKIGKEAFADCEALVSIIFNSTGFEVGENAFPDNEDLIISVKNEDDRAAIEKVCSFTKTEFYVPLDDYWIEHIDAQLETLPEGRSFIAITDTHYSSGGGNVGKSATLMDYVREKTGIKKVINLGDPHHSEKTYAEALEQLKRSMETKFFDFFGEDGMYAIGNHDSNLTASRNSRDEDASTYDMDILLSDKDIYEATFAHIEEGGKKNGNVVYDEALLDIIEESRSEITDFVLNNVTPEDAEAYNNLFGNVSYTADEMYENLVCWAKMHYAYYDHDSKICYIVLNTGALTVTDFAILNRELWKFHPSQYEFLGKMFSEISEKYSDYDVVVAGHMLYDKSTPNQTYHKDLFSMLSAFEGGTSVSFSASGNNAFSGKLFGCENGEKSRIMNYDFSGNKFEGEVFCITGHRHLDLDLVSQTKNGEYYMSVPYDEVGDDLSDNAIQLILLNQDNASENNGASEPDAEKPVKGTITEQSFTIFTITDDNTLVATRIGANSGKKQKTYNLG